MPHCRTLVFWVGTLALSALTTNAAAQDWLPITPQELSMTSEPKAPGASAIFLYRQVDRDDNVSNQHVYNRIKILTEEGREHANVEIPFSKNQAIRAIDARTIRPDGTVVEFSGTIYEKPLIQGRGIRLTAKTFTLPDVQVGGIIEYRYRHDFPSGYVFDSRWLLSDELFTRYAKFSLTPYEYYKARFSWPVGLPTGTSPPAYEKGKVRLETRDVPAFVTEDHMPPENQLKYRVDFIYLADGNEAKVPAEFWKKYAKRRFRTIDDFIDAPRVMEQAVADIVAGNDSQEAKLRKLYTRAQQFRNTSYERRRSEQEVLREEQKEAKNVGDVWKRGYGDGIEITWLFLSMVRAAGFEAHPVLVSTRDTHFFNEGVMNPYELNSNVVSVKLDGKDLLLDPGTKFAPFGLLPWSETGVKGLRLDKNGGVWVETPLPTPDESKTIRKAKLKLTTNGTIEGTVTVTFTGLEALWRRFSVNNDDETERREFLESQLRYDIPSGTNVKLINTPAWENPDVPLVAEYELRIPGWAASAGQRALLTLGVFGNGEKNTFKHAARAHPLYFNFPYRNEDEFTIELPPGWRFDNVPQPHKTDLKVVSYALSAENKDQTLHVKRDLFVNLVLVDRKYYSQLRGFFQTVRTHDETQAVVIPGRPPGAK